MTKPTFKRSLMDYLVNSLNVVNFSRFVEAQQSKINYVCIYILALNSFNEAYCMSISYNSFYSECDVIIKRLATFLHLKLKL